MASDANISESEQVVGEVTTRRKWAFRLCAASLSVLLFILFLEALALANLVDYRLVLSAPGGRAWENPRNRLDPELIHVHQSHGAFEGEIRGDLATWYGLPTGTTYPVKVEYDWHGFRNDTDMTSADMVLVGDSFVEAPIILKKNMASELLAASLDCRVLNLGQSAYGPQQELVALQRYGFSVDTKIVVWLIFEGNDLTRDLLRYERYTKDWDQFVSKMHGFRKRSFLRNVYVRLSRIVLPTRRDQRFGLERSGVLAMPGQLEGGRMYFGYNAAKLSTKDEASINRGLDVIAKASLACRQRGIKFLVAFAPIKYRVYHDLCTFKPGSKASTWSPSSMINRISHWALDNDIAFLNLTDALHTKAATGQLVYFLDDGHWNAKGNAVAAKEIEHFIRDNNWLQPAP